MAGAITAVKPTLNGITLFTGDGSTTPTTAVPSYLDVSTMDGSKVIFIVKVLGADTGAIKVTDGGAFTAGAVGDVTKGTTGGTTGAGLRTTAQTEYICGPFETSRMKDSNGRINILKSTAGDTNIWDVRAILLP